MPLSLSHLTPALRLTLLGFAGLALIAGALLFIGAEKTDQWFSWTIAPPLTAAALGGLYWGAFALFAAGTTAPDWRAVRPIAYPVLAIAIVLLVVTLIHLERFDMDSVFGIFWLCAYIAAPPLMVWAILQQRRAPAAAGSGVILLPPLHAALFAEGGAMLAIGAVMLVAPDSAADFWPWALTPLTSRALGALIGAVGLVAVLAAADREIRLARGFAAAYLIFGALQLLALGIHHGDLGDDGVANGIYVGFAAAIVLTGLYALAIAARAPSKSA